MLDTRLINPLDPSWACCCLSHVLILTHDGLYGGECGYLQHACGAELRGARPNPACVPLGFP